MLPVTCPRVCRVFSAGIEYPLARCDVLGAVWLHCVSYPHIQHTTAYVGTQYTGAANMQWLYAPNRY